MVKMIGIKSKKREDNLTSLQLDYTQTKRKPKKTQLIESSKHIEKLTGTKNTNTHFRKFKEQTPQE